MVLRRSYIAVFLLMFLAMPRVVFAEEVLSDDEAYSRAYSYCYSRVSPMWSPKAGEKPPKRTAADRELSKRKTVECMKQKGVPVRYDMSEGIVVTGKGFGENVHIGVMDIFPESVLSPDTISREMPDVMKAVLKARKAGEPVALPAFNIEELVPREMWENPDINLNNIDVEKALSELPDYLRSRVRTDGSAMPDSQETVKAMGLEYDPAGETVEQGKVDGNLSRNVALQDNPASEAEDQKQEIRREPAKPSGRDLPPSDNVTAAGQDDSNDGYEVKPIFLGR